MPLGHYLKGLLLQTGFSFVNYFWKDFFIRAISVK